MNYELATKLKNAGFPQHHDYRGGDEYPFCVKCNGSDSDHDREYVPCMPSLSELIEACGKTFVMLIRVPSGWEAVGRMGEFEDEASDTMRCGGITHEEAVAKLWLALNTK